MYDRSNASGTTSSAPTRSSSRAPEHSDPRTSQHTSVRPPNVADLKPSAVTPAPPRPLKRLRADSDTSLVLKASRFTVVEAEDDAPRPSFSRVMLPSPPRVTGARESVQRHHLDQSDRPSESRPGSSSESPAKPANGSAPITPPRSST
ncbi:hypothetical protein [Sporisorium scitamineum]|uniref:Uncharacterized protein n=1 Tax=Sporisorium scitamineum TaxID=49012 RepID=A0A0F7S920_9BASI|nr:hypothetical protein [Sporisorium scitamineum]